jgi:hypothetical protein
MITINDQVNIDFLKGLLSNGSLPVSYIMREAKEERLKRGLVGTTSRDFTKTAMHRAKKKLGIRTVREGSDIWAWVMPC